MLPSLAFAVLGVGTARLGIFSGPGHLAVRDIVRTCQVCWPEIASFEVPPRYGTWRKAGLRIHLIDGRLISATLYARGGFGAGRAAATAVRELDKLRRQRIADRADQRPPACSATGAVRLDLGMRRHAW